ncbi:hypothetical protein QBC44DRAFT_401443 [Cladorrhinum sp. PSN332]|nr:hypothetical protein QBC44DRAFT_401443 [Cladorrhinum sp. PSN332]
MPPKQSKKVKAPLRPGEQKATFQLQVPASLSLDLRTQLQSWLMNLDDEADHARESPNVNNALTEEEYDGIMGMMEDDSWVVADSLALEQDMNTLDGVIKENLPKNTVVQQLWRLVPRFMRCTPLELFDSRLIRVKMTGQTFNVGIGREIHSPIWPRNFCERLRTLVVHPFFASSPSLLAVVVQYVIKLRTNDRRHWPLRHETSDKFLDEMAQAFSQAHPTKASFQIHREVRERFPHGMATQSPISGLLSELEKNTTPAKTPAESSTAPFEPYVVATSDLTAIQRALDGWVTATGAKQCVNSQLNFDWVKHVAANTHDHPVGNDGVINAIQNAMRRSIQSTKLRIRRGEEAELGDIEDPEFEELEDPSDEEEHDDEKVNTLQTRIQELEAENAALKEEAKGASQRSFFR